MKPVRQYLDYRAFLHDFYEHKRQEDGFFSYRYMARKVKMDHGYLVKLMQGKVHLTEGHIPPFLSICGLQGRDAVYFKTLVRFNKSKQPEETSILFDRLMVLAGPEIHAVERNQFEYFKAWHYCAIRESLGHMEFHGDFDALARSLNPRITVKQAREGVRLLESLDLIRKDRKGVYRPTGALLTTGPGLEASAVRQFQMEMIGLGKRSLQRDPKEQRDISTVTLSLDLAELQEVRDRIAVLRQSLMSLAAKTPKPNAIYQLNVQLFPLSQFKGRDP